MNFRTARYAFATGEGGSPNIKQAISAREQALCQLTVCFEFQSRSDRRKGHKSCALEMVFRRKVRK